MTNTERCKVAMRAAVKQGLNAVLFRPTRNSEVKFTPFVEIYDWEGNYYGSVIPTRSTYRVTGITWGTNQSFRFSAHSANRAISTLLKRI